MGVAASDADRLLFLFSMLSDRCPMPDSLSPNLPALLSTATPEPAPSRRERRKRYDWALAVEMLSRGATIDAVAAAIGCHRSSLFRAIRRAPAMRTAIAQGTFNGMQSAGGRLYASAEALTEALLRSALEDRNPMVLVHLSRSLALSEWGHTWRPNGMAWPGMVPTPRKARTAP